MKLKIYGIDFNLKSFHEKLYEKQRMWALDLRDLILGISPDFKGVFSDLESWSNNWK